MQISRRKVIELGLTLMQAEHLFKLPISGRFYYACVKNRELGREEYKLSMEANPYPPQFNEYETKRVAILNEVGESVKPGFSKMDDRERDAIVNSRDEKVMPSEKREMLLKRLNDLSTEYKDLLQEVDAVNVRRNEFLDEVDDFPIKTVKLSDIPEVVEGNGFDIFLALDPMIIDDAEA